ncbi:MAG: histidine phosphatase family protein [Bacteroidetes bacterium]|nr:histidine phosphatase family protein [Bacteroidota bacterium]
MNVYLIRHGKVDNPKDVFYGRLPGYKLEESGIQDAEHAANELQGLDLDAVYYSPLTRTEQTAAVIAQQLNIDSRHSDNRLLEVNTPYEGMNNAIVREKDWDVYTGTGEGYDQPIDVLHRVQGFLQEVKKGKLHKAIAVVTHRDVIAVMLAWVNNDPITPNTLQNYEIDPGSVFKIDV